MGTAVIVDAVRTPFGRRNGVLSHWHPVDLTVEVLNALVDRVDLDPGVVDDVLLGCVSQVGEQAVNVARNAVLGAGWPERVPGATIDRQCGSGQQAAHFAAQGVLGGAYDVVVAGGVEVMTRVPMGSTMVDGKYGYPFGARMVERYAGTGGLVSQGIAAELIADEWDITREEMDEYSARSHARAREAVAEGRFEREIIAVDGADGQPVGRDEGIRETDVAVLSKLRPAFRSAAEGGRVTAGSSSQLTDGAAVMLIASDRRAADLGLPVRARFVSTSVVGGDPRLMLTVTVAATRAALDRAGLGLDDIDRFEVNEAFASPVIAWQRETGVGADRLNVNGGAIAIGHPLGATGIRLIATLVGELERIGGRYGLVTMCEGGGMANAAVIERL